MNILSTALAIIRTETSNRQAAAITSGYIQYLIAAAVLPAGSEYFAVDSKEINRTRRKVMRKTMENMKKEILEEEVKAILVDSRNTNIVRYLNKNAKNFYTFTQKKNIYTMMDGDGRFLAHFIKERIPDNSIMSSSRALALKVFGLRQVWSL